MRERHLLELLQAANRRIEKLEEEKAMSATTQPKREDALELGARLRAGEKGRSEARIKRVFADRADSPSTLTPLARHIVAETIYEECKVLDDARGEQLDLLCQKIFGAHTDEVVNAYIFLHKDDAKARQQLKMLLEGA